MKNIDELEQKVADTICRVGIEFRGIGKSNDEWTRALTDCLCERHAPCEYKPFGRGNPSEWLFDVIWLKYDSEGKWIIDVLMVLECEWSCKGIDYDFEKLLVARARLKVMIFEAVGHEQATEIVRSLNQRVSKFEQSDNSDRYLFAALINDAHPAGFDFKFWRRLNGGIYELDERN